MNVSSPSPAPVTDRPLRILAIAGSLRDQSFNRNLLDQFAKLAPAGVEIEFFNGLGGIEYFDEDLESTYPPNATAFVQAVRGADAIVIATPNYSHRIPGVLKNALDWAARPAVVGAPRGDTAVSDKDVAILSASAGFKGGRVAGEDLRGLMEEMRAGYVVPETVALGKADEAFSAPGQLKDPAIVAQLQGIMDALVAAARARQAGTPMSAPVAATA